MAEWDMLSLGFVLPDWVRLGELGLEYRKLADGTKEGDRNGRKRDARATKTTAARMAALQFGDGTTDGRRGAPSLPTAGWGERVGLTWGRGWCRKGAWGRCEPF